MTIDQVDEIDEAIIQRFQANGRISNREVARDLGLSEGAIRKRLKRLIDQNIVSYSVLLDNSIISMTVSAWIKVAARPSKVRAIAEYVSSLDGCTLCIIMSGEFNVSAHLYGRDRQDLGQLVTTISTRDGVAAIEVYESLYHTQHRYELVPPIEQGHRRLTPGLI